MCAALLSAVNQFYSKSSYCPTADNHGILTLNNPQLILRNSLKLRKIRPQSNASQLAINNDDLDIRANGCLGIRITLRDELFGQVYPSIWFNYPNLVHDPTAKLASVQLYQHLSILSVIIIWYEPCPISIINKNGSNPVRILDPNAPIRKQSLLLAVWSGNMPDGSTGIFEIHDTTNPTHTPLSLFSIPYRTAIKGCLYGLPLKFIGNSSLIIGLFCACWIRSCDRIYLGLWD